MNCTVPEAMERVSAREYIARVAAYEASWNEPDRHDYYLMRIAQRVQQQWNKERVDLEAQKLDLVPKVVKKPEQLTEEEKEARIRASQAAWIGACKAAKSARLKQ